MWKEILTESLIFKKFFILFYFVISAVQDNLSHLKVCPMMIKQ